MRLLALGTLRHFWLQRRHADAEQPLRAWVRFVKSATWVTPADVKRDFGSASILRFGRVVFNIGGNKYRVVTAIRYDRKAVFVRFIGTHDQYDNIDAETV
jgi:mRNA interferase HigB